ncbi:3'-5' ssDNA/RNA exonuclease TatD-like [Patiria miniata]|uniref:Uncharacterized protein n=1 Tax=Patiria miniata TaxID=46514 RepID=A0A914BU56_PATMI|nr:3'-5' ssDNA/RNA exonuclease TatD-like [Patiria miniata]
MNTCALGEVGLDYSRGNERSKAVQQSVFRQLLRTAVELSKPVVLHCREANDECLEIVSEILPQQWKIHLHCFINNWKTVQQWRTLRRVLSLVAPPRPETPIPPPVEPDICELPPPELEHSIPPPQLESPLPPRAPDSPLNFIDLHCHIDRLLHAAQHTGTLTEFLKDGDASTTILRLQQEKRLMLLLCSRRPLWIGTK